MLPRVHCLIEVPIPHRHAADTSTSDAARLHLLTDIVRAGVDAVQVRAQGISDRRLTEFARAVVATVRPLGAVVIVNDRVDVALTVGADGVHLGLDDLPVRAARALVPRGFLVGATCRGPEHARAARAQGADYAGVGPVYASTTKAGLPAPIGLAVLSATSSVLPSIAIAGITAERVPEVMAAGAHGVAVVAALWQADDPPSAARAIVERVRAA